MVLPLEYTLVSENTSFEHDNNAIKMKLTKTVFRASTKLSFDKDKSDFACSGVVVQTRELYSSDN